MADLAIVNGEPKRLIWRDQEVETRDVSIGVQREANKLARDGDSDGMLLHVAAHSLFYLDGPNAGKRVFRSLAQIREDVTQREYYLLMNLAVAAVNYNSPDANTLDPKIRAQIEDVEPPKSSPS